MSNSYTSNSLLILLWNANGLENHKNELLLTLQEKIIDIVLIAESHFTTNSYINLPGYDSYRAKHPDNTAHAGAAIYITSQYLNTLHCQASYPITFNPAQYFCYLIIFLSLSQLFIAHPNTLSLQPGSSNFAPPSTTITS